MGRVVARCGADGRLGDLIEAARKQGYTLITAAAFAVDSGVSTYDYLLTCSGRGTLQSVQNALAAFPGAEIREVRDLAPSAPIDLPEPEPDDS